jgi:hypothetical protein
MSKNMITKTTKTTQIRDPVLLEDGSMVFDITLTTSEVDRDNDIVNPLGVQGLDTAIVAYNHQKCYGIPVSTGAEILFDTVIQNEKELRVQIKIKATDEMFFCDLQGQKKTNGNLLEAVKKNQVNNVSVGFTPISEPTIKYINGKKIRYFDEIMIHEVSLLDVLSSNLSTKIHKFMEINKCVECVKKSGVGTLVYKKNDVYKVSLISDTEVKAVGFDGNETIVDDSFEVLSLQEHVKMCACQKEKETKDAETIEEEIKEEIAEDTQLTAIMQTLESMQNQIDALNTKVQELETTKASTEIIEESVQKHVKSNIENTILNKFAREKPQQEINKKYSYNPF